MFIWSVIGLVVTLWSLSDAGVTVRPSQVVQVSAGKIQGKTYTFENGREASAFLGIRYGKAPVGPLRFKKPLPAQSWSDIKNTTQFGNRCFSYSATDLTIPSEDCLYLNVFATGSKFNQKTPTNKLRPIAFFLHGGGFFSGSANPYGDESICRYWNLKDVIVVTLNYRLQYFGFLALDRKTPGNYGLWDMKLALEWVIKNAKAFGGDPNQITIYGQSAGAMASDLFTISPHTNKLFNKAIMFAGNSYMNVVTNKIDTLRYYARRFAIGIGYQVNESLTYVQENAALLQFFQNAPAENITIGYLASNETSGTLLTAPSLDGDFFPQSLETLRKLAPKKPVIVGVNTYEGLLFMARQPVATIYDFVKNYIVTYYPKNRPTIDSTIAEAIMQTFVNTSLPSNSTEYYKQCVVVMSDFLFNYPLWNMVRDKSQRHETTYLYNFTYFNPASLPAYQIPLLGPTHTLEIPYVFGHSLVVPTYVPTDEDVAKLEVFVGALINFINNKKPSNSWKPYDLNANKYYHFGQNTNEDGMQDQFGADRMVKWDDLYQRFNLN